MLRARLRARAGDSHDLRTAQWGTQRKAMHRSPARRGSPRIACHPARASSSQPARASERAPRNGLRALRPDVPSRFWRTSRSSRAAVTLALAHSGGAPVVGRSGRSCELLRDGGALEPGGLDRRAKVGELRGREARHQHVRRAARALGRDQRLRRAVGRSTHTYIFNAVDTGYPVDSRPRDIGSRHHPPENACGFI